MSLFNTKLENLQIELRTLKNNPPKINHILHLILTLLTGGLWVIVWIIIGSATQTPTAYTTKIVKLENKIAELQNA